MKELVFSKLHDKMGDYLRNKGVGSEAVRRTQAVYVFIWGVTKVLVAAFIAFRIYERIGFEKTLVLFFAVYLVMGSRV